jgi:hypothetical protein
LTINSHPNTNGEFCPTIGVAHFLEPVEQDGAAFCRVLSIEGLACVFLNGVDVHLGRALVFLRGLNAPL